MSLGNLSNQYRTIGILGGLGPHTSSIFYMDIINKFQRYNLQVRPPVLMWSIPLDLEVERRFIETGEGKDKYLEYLVTGATNLKKGGADFIAIPCNTVHVLIDKLKTSVGIPFLNIIEETSNKLKRSNVNKTAILATGATIKENLYNQALFKENIDIFLPDAGMQRIINDVIENILNGCETKEDKLRLHQVIRVIKSMGIYDFLLACTDLQILIDQKECSVKIHDTMSILADAVVRECLYGK